jgi:hypothetical protein
MSVVSRHLKKRWLTVSFILIIVLFLSTGILIIQGLFSQAQLTRTIYHHPLIVSNASLTAALNIAKMHRSMKDVVLSQSRPELEAVVNAVAGSERVVYQQLNLVRDHVLGEEGRTLEEESLQLFVDWEPIRETVVQQVISGSRQRAIKITQTTGAIHVDKLESKMLDLTAYARKKATRFLKQAETRQSRLKWIAVIATGLGVLLSAVIAIITISRVFHAENILREQRDKLQTALDEIKTLQGILPICAHCKQIRDDRGVWKQIEGYIRSHSEADFSHGICPDCAREHYPDIDFSHKDDQ